MQIRRLTLLSALIFLTAHPLGAAKILFDATHREMAGNADWVVDADAWNNALPAYGTCPGLTNESNPQRFPTPAQSGITAATPETFWTGGASSFAVALVKDGHQIETLPPGALITYGDGSNVQDLSNYKVFIIPEPQLPFTVAEKNAIIAFVQNGGGLFMIGDHENSDRDCDGNDSPNIYNGLTGASSSNGGLFGIWFRVGAPTKGSESWFDEGTNTNVSTNPADPIIHGPFGDGSGGLGLFGATSMDLFPAQNASVAGHLWRNTQIARDNSRVTFATAQYGSGRVAAIGDSSPLDDGSGDPSDSLYGGWDKAVGGVANDKIHLNAVSWLLNAAPDTTPPVITSGPAAAADDCGALISWTTDEPATTRVNYGLSAAYGSAVSGTGFTQAHAAPLTGLSPATLYHYQASSTDSTGNGPTLSADGFFTTGAASPPVILTGPTATVNGTSVTLAWTTNELSTSAVEYGTTIAYGSTAGNAVLVTAHSVTITGLSAQTDYHFRAGSTDGCGNGPTWSGDALFTTGNSGLDVSGWVLEQFNSALTYTIPAGTVIPSGGYLIVARDAAQASFEAGYGTLPAGTLYLNSNPNGSCTAGCFPQVNGGESYRLKDNLGAVRDGTTITFTAQNKANQRTAPGAPAGTAGSWTINPNTSANPGAGAGASSAAGVVINEVNDPSSYPLEYVELYNDAGSVDITPPAPINPLAASPVSDVGVRLNFIAVGDDGTTGTATSYQVHYSSRPILSEADFSAATAASGLPAPKTANQAEVITISGLIANTTYCFAIKAVDEASNAGALSNSPCATTGLTGSGGGGANHLVISQIRVAGGTDDFVELFNPTATTQSLSGYSAQYLAAAGGFGTKIALPAFSMPAGSWYLVAGTGYAGPPAADLSSVSIAFGGTAGHVLLVGNTTNAACATVAIDKVGYGATATCPEGGSGKNTAAPGAGLSVTRKAGDATGSRQDTDVNSTDFLGAAAPVIHNSGSAPASSGGSGLGNVGPSLFLSASTPTRLNWAAALNATTYHAYRTATLPGFGTVWNNSAASTTTDASTPAPVWFYLILASDGTNESAN